MIEKSKTALIDLVRHGFNQGYKYISIDQDGSVYCSNFLPKINTLAIRWIYPHKEYLISDKTFIHIGQYPIQYACKHALLDLTLLWNNGIR